MKITLTVSGTPTVLADESAGDYVVEWPPSYQWLTDIAYPCRAAAAVVFNRGNVIRHQRLTVNKCHADQNAAIAFEQGLDTTPTAGTIKIEWPTKRLDGNFVLEGIEPPQRAGKTTITTYQFAVTSAVITTP